MSVDLAAIQRAIQTLPWVEHARMQRAWPRGLHVPVIEQTAAARWGESGCSTRAASCSSPTSATCRRSCRSCRARTARSRRWRSATSPPQGRLLEAGLRITALRLDARGAWEFDLANGVTVRLGRRQVDERFEHFMNTASQVVSQRG